MFQFILVRVSKPVEIRKTGTEEISVIFMKPEHRDSESYGSFLIE